MIRDVHDARTFLKVPGWLKHTSLLKYASKYIAESRKDVLRKCPSCYMEMPQQMQTFFFYSALILIKGEAKNMICPYVLIAICAHTNICCQKFDVSAVVAEMTMHNFEMKCIINGHRQN